MSRRLPPVLFIVVLILATLACNIPGGSVPSAPSSPASTESSSLPSPLPPTDIPPSSSSGGACDNSLYPVVVGASWSYSFTGALPGNFTRSITAVNVDGFTDQDVFDSGITRTGEWKCDHGALIALQPDAGSSGTVQAENVSASFETTSMSGITFPATANVGDTWSQNFTLEGTEKIKDLEIPAKNETAFSCTVGNTESVTVPAGTFDAIRMDCKTDIAITITMNGVAVPTNVSTTSKMWYAPGVGMVKSDNVLGADTNSTIELTAYTIP
jgi:hypothetical protein